MRAERKLSLILAVCGSLVPMHHASGEVTCHKINTKGAGQIDFVTNSSDGRFIGGGLLRGTTHGAFAFTSFDPTTGIGTYAGTFTITTKHGTLILQVFDGIFNEGTGVFSNDSKAIAGTGRFQNATGGLFFDGIVAPDGSYTDEISGEVCLDLAPGDDLLGPE